VVLADGFFVWPFKRALHLSFGVVVELDLPYAEPGGLGVAGVFGDLRDGLGGQFQIRVEADESWRVVLLSFGVLMFRRAGQERCCLARSLLRVGQAARERDARYRAGPAG
jgi:hypothetical protein